MNEQWFAQPEDTIGGWCVTSSPEPPSAGLRNVVADFVNEDAARHIALLHNTWLIRQADKT